MEIKNIAKLSSYGAYIDEEFIYTNSLVEGKNVIVGNIAEYMYDLEQELAKKESDTARELAKTIKSVVWEEFENETIRIKDLHGVIDDILRSKYGVGLGE